MVYAPTSTPHYAVEVSERGYRAMFDHQPIIFSDACTGADVEYFSTEKACLTAIRTGQAY